MIVHGYVREMQTILYPKIIPQAIYMLCISYYDPFIQLASPQVRTSRYPTPLYYYSKTEDRDYIIFAPDSTETKSVSKYDIQNNCFELLTTYPDDVSFELTGAVIDTQNDILYFLFGFGSVFAMYDLKNDKWTVKCDGSANMSEHLGIDHGASDPFVVYTESNELHVILLGFKNKHYIFNENQNKFIWSGKVTNEQYLDTDALIYCKHKKCFLILGGYCNDDGTDKMWICDLVNNENKWSQCKCKLPIQTSTMKGVIAFDHIIIVYDRTTDGMWYLDVGIEQSQWEWIVIDMNRERLKEISAFSIVVTPNHFLHFVNSFGTAVHAKINLYNILPTSVCLKYINV